MYLPLGDMCRNPALVPLKTDQIAQQLLATTTKTVSLTNSHVPVISYIMLKNTVVIFAARPRNKQQHVQWNLSMMDTGTAENGGFLMTEVK